MNGDYTGLLGIAQIVESTLTVYFSEHAWSDQIAIRLAVLAGLEAPISVCRGKPMNLSQPDYAWPFERFAAAQPEKSIWHGGYQGPSHQPPG